MRRLTQREKILLVAVAVIAVISLVMTIEPVVRQGFSGGELAAKREQLQTARDLIRLHEIVTQIDDKVQERVGLQGKTISEPLYKELSERANVESLNRARSAADLALLHPALEGKASTLLAYKKERGQFENMEVLKEIQGPIFEGEQPEAVISQRISELAQRAELPPNYQLNIKQTPGKKAEKISSQAVGNLIWYLYLSELEAELGRLQEAQKAAEAKRAEAEQGMMDAMFEGWFDAPDAAVPEDENKETGKPSPDAQSFDAEAPAKSTPKEEKKPAPEPLDKETRPKQERQFAALPETIPLSIRIQLIQFIQSSLKQEMAGAGGFKKGFLEDQISMETVKVRGGFLGIGPKREIAQVKLKPDSVLLLRFQELIQRYKEEQTNGQLEAGAKDALDGEQQIHALTAYVDQVLQRKKQLHDWFTKAPRTYQPDVYMVEMKFNGEIDKLVRFIHSIESTSRWLQVRDLKISIADKQKTILSTDISLIAKIL